MIRRPNVLVMISDYSWPAKNAVAATLAWMTAQVGWLSEVYYDSYRIGVHFGGGALEGAGSGEAFGSLFWSGRHLERLLLLNSMAEVHYVIVGSVSLTELIPWEWNRTIANETTPELIYRAAMRELGVSAPRSAVWIGSKRGKLNGIDSYCYPEICVRQALGFSGALDRGAVESLKTLGIESVTGMFCTREERDVVLQAGLVWETLDELKPDDTYGSVTQRISLRSWKPGDGFFAGDPVVASYWLPWNCRQGRLPLYGEPQSKSLDAMAKQIQAGPSLVFGRQYDDRDFKVLSEQGRCFQLVDPLRPAFPVISDIQDIPQMETRSASPSEPSDAELEVFAREGKILASLLFWSGAVRELENLDRLFELAASMELRMGVILTSESYRFGHPSPLKSLVWPFDRGGVFPLVEPLLGSFGEGIGLEGYADSERIRESLVRGMDRIRMVTGGDHVPCGWWPTLDGKLVPAGNFGAKNRGRPYAKFLSDRPQRALWEAVRSAGLKYAFSTFGYGRPAVLHREEDFMVLNQTAGVWEGWSPFVDIPSFGDLQDAEKMLVASGDPGWLVGTLDSCVWTFANPHWSRGSELRRMAQLLRDGGRSGKLVNVTPHTLMRYARVLLDRGYLKERGPVGPKRVTPVGYVRWMDTRIRKVIKRKGWLQD
ncbi:MAG: hypothetical protein C4529_09640 [Deltaproteobacteria bacterium]|nr:MAG: hypothetical protein C4529_09640 [Deltaproteobacteria bacterium]